MIPEKIENNSVRLIVTAAIMSGRFLRRYRDIHQDRYYTDVPFARTVLAWCLDYWKNHQQAPQKSIGEIFKLKEHEVQDEDEYQLIRVFLEHLSENHDPELFDENLAFEEAERYCRAQNLIYLSKDIQQQLERRDLDEIEAMVSNWRSGAAPRYEAKEMLQPDELLKVMEPETQKEVIFKYNGALGDFIGPVRRGDFITLVAPEKRGKTQYLLDAAIRAYKAGKSVLFISAGDMDEDDIRERLFHYITGVDPLEPAEFVMIPTLDCLNNQFQTCERGIAPDQEPVKYNAESKKGEGRTLTWEDDPHHIPCIECFKDKKKSFRGTSWMIRRDLPEFSKKQMRATVEAFLKRWGDPKRFRVMTFPSDTLTVPMIRDSIADLNDYEDFNCGLCAVDYADILASHVQGDFRHQQNSIWLKGRGVSTEMKVALLWATQGNKSTYDKENIEQGDLSEDKRKLGHVTLAVALNQTEAEKAMGIIRMAKLAARKRAFFTKQSVKILHSFAYGKPVLSSYL